MRHINNFRLFENLSVNEDYITLSHFLYDLFDKWDIVKCTGETFSEEVHPYGYDSPGYPVHKFWTFRSKNWDPVLDPVMGSTDIEKIKDLVIYNIKQNEIGQFKLELDQILDDVRSVIDKGILVSAENSYEFVDYILKIQNYPALTSNSYWELD